jgi:diguanylate cyclase (GGDEF)-like protein
VLAVVIVASAAGAYQLLAPQGATPTDPGIASWWALGLLFVAAELYVSSSWDRLEELALAPHDAVVALSLFLIDPAGLLAVQVAAAGVAFIVVGSRSRAPLSRFLALTAGTGASVLVFGSLTGVGDLRGPLGWVSALVAVIAGLVTRSLAEIAYARLSGERPVRRDLERGLALALAGAGASASIAVAAVELLRTDRAAASLLLIPFLSVALALRAYSREHRRLVHLRLLYDSMQTVHRASGREAGMHELLDATRRLLGTDLAWIVLFDRRGTDSSLVAWVGSDESSHLGPSRMTGTQGAAVELVAGATGPLLVRRGSAEGVLAGLLVDLGLDQAIATPLRGESGVLGVLVVGDRAPEAEALGSESMSLLETYAEHAAILLENDRLEQSVSDLEELKEQLHVQAYHDALTGLPNRSLFAEQVANALSGCPEAAPAVLFLDLDDFKLINDSLGHHAGDELLVAVAHRVRGAVRAGDVPARLGGDEFAVLAQDGGAGEAERIAERLVKALEAPFTIDGREMSVHASVGIALGRPGATTVDELLRNADVAMYSAKHGGKRRFTTYAPKMHTRIRHRQELVTALERAVERDEIGVHYQPIVDLETRALVAVEALARWDRPLHGLIGPGAFIPLADEIGLMVGIGRSVLRQACRQARSWQTAFAGHESLRVNVNLSPSELSDPGLVADVTSILKDSGLAPSRLVLEITESGVMRSPDEALATMSTLRQLGVSLALDDFGTGHSSLAHLREFPIDSLKIAREFVSGLPEGHVDNVFVDAIVRLASSLGLDVVAEGVESERQAALVRQFGCGFGQGYYFGAPLGLLGVSSYLGAHPLPGGSVRVA